MSCEHNQSEESYIYSITGHCTFCDIDSLRDRLADARRGHSWLSDCVAIQQRRAEDAEHRAALVESVHTGECDGFNCAYCNFARVAGELNAVERELDALRDAVVKYRRIKMRVTKTGREEAERGVKLYEAGKLVDALAAAPAEEEKRRLPIICTNCGEEWSDGHAETCEPTLAAPADEGKT